MHAGALLPTVAKIPSKQPLPGQNEFEQTAGQSHHLERWPESEVKEHADKLMKALQERARQVNSAERQAIIKQYRQIMKSRSLAS